MEIYPEIALRVGIQESSNGQLGVAFFRTMTSVNVAHSLEDHMITIPVRKAALGELYLLLKKEVEENFTEYGFEAIKPS